MSSLFQQCLAVGVGGFFGALARFGVATLYNPTEPGRFPWGTLIANLTGCLLLGLLKAPLTKFTAQPLLTYALLTGFLGAYTTFSTFSVETVELARTAGARMAIVYGGTSVVLGLALAAIGMILSEQFAGAS